jgi:hypothetical protein
VAHRINDAVSTDRTLSSDSDIDQRKMDRCPLPVGHCHFKAQTIQKFWQASPTSALFVSLHLIQSDTRELALWDGKYFS